jgi:hypothetical protein
MTFTTREQMTTYSGNNGSAVKFYGPNGQSATVVKGDDGQQAIKITDSNNNSVTYISSGTAAIKTNNNYNTSYFGSTGDTIPPNNLAYTGSAGVVNPPGTVGPSNPPGNSMNNYNPPGTAGPSNPPGSSSSYDYSSSLPEGIPRNQILPGQEDLYILKSEVVPPVCPVCPVASNAFSDSDNKKCPPCEPCGRCPEPSMTCKAVPNYNAKTNQYLPIPVLNSFSTFGM